MLSLSIDRVRLLRWIGSAVVGLKFFCACVLSKTFLGVYSILFLCCVTWPKQVVCLGSGFSYRSVSCFVAYRKFRLFCGLQIHAVSYVYFQYIIHVHVTRDRTALWSFLYISIVHEVMEDGSRLYGIEVELPALCAPSSTGRRLAWSLRWLMRPLLCRRLWACRLYIVLLSMITVSTVWCLPRLLHGACCLLQVEPSAAHIAANHTHAYAHSPPPPAAAAGLAVRSHMTSPDHLPA